MVLICFTLVSKAAHPYFVRACVEGSWYDRPAVESGVSIDLRVVRAPRAFPYLLLTYTHNIHLFPYLLKIKSNHLIFLYFILAVNVSKNKYIANVSIVAMNYIIFECPN